MISCGEKDVFTPQNSDFFEPILTTEILEDAKSYYLTKTKTLNLKESEGPSKTKKLEPIWSRAKKVLLENGDNIVLVPVADYKIISNEVKLFRCFIFKEQNDKIIDGRIVEFVGDIDYIVKNGEMIIKKFGKNQIDKFNGVVSSYDLNYNYLDGYFFVRGIKQNATARIYSSSKSSTDNPNGRVASTLRTQTEGGCSDFYLVTYYSDGSQSWSWLFGSCGGGPEFTTPPGAITELKPGSAGGINNNLVRPCFTRAFNTLLNSSFNNKVQTILQNFNKSSTLNFTIAEGPNPGSARAAQTVGNVITLNTSILQNSTEAYVAAIIYHEVLHVFLGNATQIADHTEMATKYIDPLAQAIKYTYNLSNSDANALAWTGLGSTTAWTNPGPNTPLAASGAKNAIIDTQLAYQNLGNDCK